jgi:hypothetical protein
VTSMEYRRLVALQRRTVYAAPADIVAAMDQIRETYPDPRTRPAAAAEVHDKLARQLNTRKET